MSAPPQGVIIFHGEDEFGIAQAVAKIEQEMGDPSIALLNTTRLDGRYLTLDELTTAARVVPFMASRRLVVLTQACQKLNQPTQRDGLFRLVESLPESTVLVLVEYQTLVENHWLVEWARKAGSKVSLRCFPSKKGDSMAHWIEEEAKALGGQITQPAAGVLASLVGDDSRAAYQEIEKLLTYAGSKAVHPDDVRELSAFGGEANIFVLVDGLGHQDGKKISRALRLLLTEQDPLQIFSMIVRQFRLLIMTREILDNGGRDGDVRKKLHVADFQAKKIMAQARHYSLDSLEKVYHKLLELDDGIKTGLYEGDVALEMFVLSFTKRIEQGSR